MQEISKSEELGYFKQILERNVPQDENSFSGPLDQKRSIQAIKIDFSRPFHDVYYSVYHAKKSVWTAEVPTAEMSGTTGRSKPIKGIKIRLDEAGAKEFDIIYRLHKFNGEWTSWAKNGEELYSQGLNVNAIQIKLEPKLTLQETNHEVKVLHNVIKSLRILRKSLAAKGRRTN